MAAWYVYRKRKPVTAEAWVVRGTVPLATTRPQHSLQSQQQQQLQGMSPEALRSHAVNRFKTSVVVCLFLLHNKVSKVRLPVVHLKGACAQIINCPIKNYPSFFRPLHTNGSSPREVFATPWVCMALFIHTSCAHCALVVYLDPLCFFSIVFFVVHGVP